MRIAVVTPYSLSRPGGVQSHVLEFADVLRGRGVDVDLVGPLDGEPPAEGVVGVGRSVGFRDAGSIVPVALGPGAIVRTARLVLGGGYDLVHVHEPMLPWVSLTATAAAPVPLVGTFHMYNARQRWYRPFAPLCRRLLDRLAVRIAVSEPARRHVARSCPGEYRIVPNGIDLDAVPFEPGAREGRRILFVGRAERRKGVPTLLEAFARLGGEPVLELAGASADEVERLAPDLPRDVAARVRAHGPVGPEERDRLLERADVLAMPSIQGESLPRVLLEGLAAGLPVVASDVPGNADLLDEGCARLVPPGEHEPLAAALAELLGDDELRGRLGETARERAARFDWDRVADEILAIYDEALSRGPIPLAGAVR